MKVIKAEEDFNRSINNICVYLAGGTAGANWREQVIDILNSRYDTNDGVIIFDPVNENYYKEIEKQVHWEVTSLIHSGLVCFYFYGTETDCPISFFELGYYLCMIIQYSSYLHQDPIKYIEIAVSDDFCKKKDLIYRCRELGFPVDVLKGTPEQNYEDIAFKLTCKIDNILR